MNRKISLLAAMGIFALLPNIVNADTITVTNYLAGGTVSPNGITAPGEETFYYLVNLDGSTNLQSGDGFVIYDFFGPVLAVNYSDTTLVPGTENAAFPASQFLLNDTLTTGNALKDSGLNYDSGSQLTVTDNSAIQNLSFVFTAPPDYAGDGSDSVSVVLAITTTFDANTTSANAVGVDHSGTPEDGYPYSQYSVSGSYVTVPTVGHAPTSTPLPASALSGSALLGLMAFGKLRTRKHSA